MEVERHPAAEADVRHTRRRLVAMVVVVALGFSVSVQGQAAVPPPKRPTVLFMCPHGAAKSVLASAYFQRLAKERGLNVHVVSAGTDPDPQVAPTVAHHLTKDGYEVPISKPRRVTESEMSTADGVISIGCDLKGLTTPRGTLVKWDDVPALSDDFAVAGEKIRERVMQLVDELVRKQHR